MTPARPSRLLPLLGCLAALLAALALGACGGDAAATADGTAQAQPRTHPEAGAGGGRPCPGKVDAFVDSLGRLRHQLAVGLSYEQYAARVEALRASYDRIPTDHLALACLTTTGTPAEKALNKYIDAANSWGECLADASCTTAAIEPVLQRKWRVASRLLSEAQ